MYYGVVWNAELGHAWGIKFKQLGIEHLYRVEWMLNRLLRIVRFPRAAVRSNRYTSDEVMLCFFTLSRKLFWLW